MIATAVACGEYGMKVVLNRSGSISLESSEIIFVEKLPCVRHRMKSSVFIMPQQTANKKRMSSNLFRTFNVMDLA